MGVSIGASRLIVAADGKVVVPGLDYEGRALHVHERNRQYIVVKISSGSGWSGVGMPRCYVPARFDVYRITGKSKANVKYMGVTGEEIPIEHVIDFPLRPEKP